MPLPSRSVVRSLLPGAILALAALAAPAGAQAASTCAAQQIAVTPLQTSVFYIDADQSYLGSYVGYRVANTGTSARDGLWLQLESFTGGVLAPASGAPATSPLPLDDLAGGAADPAYAYLKAASATTAAQGYDVVVYSGRPGAGGTELCRETQTVTAVADVIKAAANKVTGASLSSTSATLGSTFQLTVTGNTGTIGAGPGNDPGVVRFSPAVAASWPSSAFRLTSVSHKLPSSGAALTDVLARSGLGGWADTPYAITYTFRVVGPTSSPTPVAPVQNIASGTQVKHTDPGTVASLAPIPVVTSSATAQVGAPEPGPYVPGAAVPLTATLHNTGAAPIEVDEVVVDLPAGWSYRDGSATRDGDATPDPHATGATHLAFVGPFTVPANGDCALAFDATAGAPGSTGDVTAYGLLGGGHIDATTAAGDDVPASRTLTVLGPPAARDDAAAAAAGASADFDVLANDDLTGATPTLTIADPPAHGTATVVDGRIHYVPQDGYTGGDALRYTVTTDGGSASATVAITVAAPPAAPSLATTGIGAAPQSTRLSAPLGGTLTLLDELGLPADRVTLLGQGTYVLDPATGVVTFTPVVGFTGTAHVGYRVTDAGGLTADAAYGTTVTPPAPPTTGDERSTGGPAEDQVRAVTVPDGGHLTLLDSDGTPVTTVTVPGQGRYVLDTTQGLVTFTPEPGFTGTPQPVRYRVTDAYGQASEARYQPEVVAGSDTGTPTTTTTPAETAPAPAQPEARRTTVPAKACLSRRTMTLNWRVSPTRRLRSIRIAVTGRPTLRLSGRARRATVDLRGRVRETVRVQVIARTTTARTLSTTRTYHPCRARMAHAPLPTLTLRPQR